MTQHRMFEDGSEDGRIGITLECLCALMESMEAAGADSEAMFNAQHIAVVQDGSAFAPSQSLGGSFGLFFSGGLAVFMPAGSTASVIRKNGSKLHMSSSLDGAYESNGKAPYAGDFSVDVSRIPAGAIEWLKTGERGRSSLALSNLFFGLPEMGAEDSRAAPLDGADLRRCVQFLEQTGTMGRIGEAAAMSPAWAQVVERWGELASLLSAAMTEQGASASAGAIVEILSQAEAAARAKPASRPKQ